MQYGQMGLDILGLNIDTSNILPQLQSSVLQSVAASPQIQQAGVAAAQQKVALSLADKILANKKAIMYGAGAIIVLLAIVAFKKR